jgi:small subunit ribosomal protein S17
MKKLTGKVVSVKNLKTAIVEVENHFRHPLYKKYLTRTKKYACHLEAEQQVSLGQKVGIAACRKMSKTKAFKVI